MLHILPGDYSRQRQRNSTTEKRAMEAAITIKSIFALLTLFLAIETNKVLNMF